MEGAILLFLSLAGSVVAAGGHHINCFNNLCEDAIPNCNIVIQGQEYTGVCVEDKHCKHDCGVPHGHDGCCCYGQRCVDRFNNQQASQSQLVRNSALMCPDCHDFNHCDMHLHRCHHDDEVCMIRKHKDNRMESKCAKWHECEHAREDARRHPDEQATCCGDNNCTQTAIAHHTTGHTNSLHCTDCHDVLTNDCKGDHTCHPDEVCMINHIDRRVESRCVKHPDCDHHFKEGLHDPNRLTICCTDLNCTQAAFNQVNHVTVGSGNVHTTQSGNVHTTQSGNVHTTQSGNVHTTHATQTCTDIEDATFNCADYARDFDICNRISGTGLVLATTRCKNTCGLCGGSGIGVTGAAQTNFQPSTTQTPRTTNRATTQAPKLPTTAQLQTTIQPSPITQSSTTTQSPTNLVSANLPPCVDHDIKNSCTNYAFYFCAATSGQARQFAIANCAKTCNLCKEFYASLINGAGSHTGSPFTTTQASTVANNIVV